MKNLFKIDVNLVIEKLENESVNVKNRFTCETLINMINNTDLLKIAIETNKNGNGYNKGSLVECLTRYQILSYLGFNVSEIEKSLNGSDINLSKRNKDLLNDLELSNTDYEIKTITSLARASRIADLSNAKNIIIVDLRKSSIGAYLVDKNDLVLYQNCKPTDNAYNSIKDYNNAKYLNLLSELLGLTE